MQKEERCAELRNVKFLYGSNLPNQILPPRIALYTPTFQYFYTDISAISVTFRNSGCAGGGGGYIALHFFTIAVESQWNIIWSNCKMKGKNLDNRVNACWELQNLPKVRIEFAKNAKPEVNRNKNISHWENHESNFYLHWNPSFQVVTSSSVFRLFWTLTKIKIYAAWERHYTCYEKNNLVLNTEHWYLNTNTHPWILNTEYWNLNTSTHHWLWILNTDT